jgi:hypothetical protein
MPKTRTAFRGIERLTELSYSTMLTLWLTQAVVFAVVYFALTVFVPQHGPSQLLTDPTLLSMFGDSLYYSITTATTVGYGDITPQGFSKFVASLQSIVALFLWALFVTKLVSHRQDIALKEVHRISYEEVFHNLHEGLFIMRKDFDRIMRRVRDQKELHADDWLDLITAYRQGQSILQEIPDFYGSAENRLYTLDERREQLLHEAVHRTLRRLDDMLTTLSECEINWLSHESNMAELKNLLDVIGAVMPRWRDSSPYEGSAFEDIIRLHEDIHAKLAQVPLEQPAPEKEAN